MRPAPSQQIFCSASWQNSLVDRTSPNAFSSFDGARLVPSPPLAPSSPPSPPPPVWNSSASPMWWSCRPGSLAVEAWRRSTAKRSAALRWAPTKATRGPRGLARISTGCAIGGPMTGAAARRTPGGMASSPPRAGVPGVPGRARRCARRRSTQHVGWEHLSQDFLHRCREVDVPQTTNLHHSLPQPHLVPGGHARQVEDESLLLLDESPGRCAQRSRLKGVVYVILVRCSWDHDQALGMP